MKLFLLSLAILFVLSKSDLTIEANNIINLAKIHHEVDPKFDHTTLGHDLGFHQTPHSKSQPQKEITIPTLPVGRSTLASSTNPAFTNCNNNICPFVESLLTCKTFGIHMSKECAPYLIGFLFSCDGYPAPIDFFTAPNICSTEFAKMAILANITTVISSLSAGNAIYSFGCDRRCYQNMLANAANFHTACYNVFAQNPTIAKEYTLMGTFYQYSEYFSQVCVGSPEMTSINVQYSLVPFLGKTDLTIPVPGGNCHDAFFSAMGSLNSGSSNSGGLNTLFKTQNSGTDFITIISTLVAVNAPMRSLGDCFGTMVAMLNQNQGTTPQMYPPSMMRYILHAQNRVNGTVIFYFDFPPLPINPTRFVYNNGSTGSLTAFYFNMTLDSDTIYKIVNVYDFASVVHFLGQVAATFVQVNPSLSAYPYDFNPNYPFRFAIIDYMYYASGVPRTTSEFPFMSTDDIRNLTSVDLTLQITITGMASPSTTLVQSALQSPKFIPTFIGITKVTSMALHDISPTTSLEPNPIQLPPQSSAPFLAVLNRSLLIGLFAVLVSIFSFIY